MVKAALLSLEKNIVEFVEEIKETSTIDMILMKVICDAEAEAVAREAEDEGADVILSYGLPSLAESKSIKLPVINIMLSGHDIGLLLSEAKERLRPRKPEIALMLYSCMFRRSSSLGELLGVGFKTYLLDEFENNEAAVAKAVEDGANMIIGVHDIRTLSESRGIPSMDIFSGKEGVSFAFRNVRVVSQAIELDKKKNAENDAFMNSVFHGIIVVDRNGNILRLNDYAQNLLDCKNRDIIGQPLLKFFPRSIKDNLNTVLTTGQQVFTLNIELLKKNMMTNIEPIISENEVIGAVITMQKGQFVQKKIPETQNEVYLRGFRATHRFEDIKAKSESYENLIKQAQIAAYGKAPVLLYGEEGTETLMLAECIHNCRGRQLGGFVEVDCSAWETEHLDEMLFGKKNHRGDEGDIQSLIDLAEDGTLFLNHIDVLVNELQFKVCRLIRGALPRSDNRLITSNARVIAATDKNLNLLKNEGKFRSDLYYALHVLTLDIPPLRERKEDLETWIDYFLDHYCHLYSKPIQLSKGACRCMYGYPWPGNLRQLENFCHRLVLLTQRRNIDEAFVRNEIDQMDQNTDALEEKRGPSSYNEEASKIVDALKRNGGNRTETARELGISKTTLWRMMQKYGITTAYTV